MSILIAAEDDVGTDQQHISPRHGAIGAISWGIVGAIAAFLAVAIYGLYDWWNEFDMAWGYRDWLGWVVGAATMPMVVSATIFACAGWASSAIRPPQRFILSLLIVFLTSIVMWITIATMEVTPRRYKGMDHPAMYPSEMLVAFGPPIFVAAFLTIARRYGSAKSPTSSTNT